MPPELPDPVLVQDPAAFRELTAELGDYERIAVDTEADSFFAYREKVCLIQLTAGDQDWLVDPLAGFDLEPFGAVLADPGRLKVFHDGEYDVLLFKRQYGFEFANLFDTRVAASVLGSPNPGLANVLSDQFGVQLDKSQQRSNWGKRPLSAKQIDYARLDTHFLLPLMDRQREELEERGRLEVLDGECRRLEALEAGEVEFQPDEWVRIRGARDLTPRGRRALRELFALRDELARAADEPPFRVMQNDALIAIAAAGPRSVQELADLNGISWRQARKLGDRVLETLRRARELEPIQRLPQLPRRDGTGGLSPEQIELYERIKTWRKKRSQKEGFDASLVLNRHAMIRLAADSPRSLEELEAVEGMVAWQVERFGAQLVELLETFRRDLAAGRVEIGRRNRVQRSR